ncbi:MAG: sporulation protein YqfD [Clostridia bacterium]|nr:sporulation protein YqfD [Clostridia bacterium]
MNLAYFLLGYAVLRIERAYAEQVLNLCMHHGLVYLDGGSDAAYLRLCQRGVQARKLCSLMEHAGVPYTVEKRGGIPQLIKRLAVRPGILLGAVCAIGILIASECFVFDIRVSGNSTLTASAVKQLLAEQGFTIGTFIPSVDTDQLENRVMIASDQIAWLSVNIKGNVANVELIEQKLPDPVSVLRPAHVVAKCSGEVVRVEMYRGNVLVAAGKQVKAGEILIAGVYDSQVHGFRFTRASGKVFARTVHEFEVFVPYEYEKKVYTGEILEKKSLIFFSFPIKVFQSTGNWGMVCDKIDIVENYSPIPDVELPLYMHTERYLPYEMQAEVRDTEEALALAYRELSVQIAGALSDGELLEKRIRTKIGEDGVTLYAGVVCIADIATVQEFELDLKDKQ